MRPPGVIGAEVECRVAADDRELQPEEAPLEDRGEAEEQPGETRPGGPSVPLRERGQQHEGRHGEDGQVDEREQILQIGDVMPGRDAARLHLAPPPGVVQEETGLDAGDRRRSAEEGEGGEVGACAVDRRPVHIAHETPQGLTAGSHDAVTRPLHGAFPARQLFGVTRSADRPTPHKSSPGGISP